MSNQTTSGRDSSCVERGTEKRSATLARVRSPGAARDQLSVQTLSVSVQPPCAITCICISGQVKNPRHRQVENPDTGRLKIPDTGSHAVALDTQAAARAVVIGMSNALLAAAVTIPG